MSTLGRRALLHGGVATAALFAVSRPVHRSRTRPAPAWRARPRPTLREVDMTELTGVIPITATPFDAEGRVKEETIWPS